MSIIDLFKRPKKEELPAGAQEKVEEFFGLPFEKAKAILSTKDLIKSFDSSAVSAGQEFNNQNKPKP